MPRTGFITLVRLKRQLNAAGAGVKTFEDLAFRSFGLLGVHVRREADTTVLPSHSTPARLRRFWSHWTGTGGTQARRRDGRTGGDTHRRTDATLFGAAAPLGPLHAAEL